MLSASMESSCGSNDVNLHHDFSGSNNPFKNSHSTTATASSSFPPIPPTTPTNVNTCRALIQFEFPKLPRLVCNFDFAEVSAGFGLRSFPAFETSYARDGSNGGGYGILNSSGPSSTNNSRSLIPYGQQDLHQKVRSHTRGVQNKSYNNWATLRRQDRERKLRKAAGAGSLMIVQKLIANGVNPNAADEMGRTALHKAASKGFCDIMSLLLQAGANPNQKDADGNTPLHLSAASTNHFEVVTCLLQAGSDVNTLNNSGRNPLQLAQSKLKSIMLSDKLGNDFASKVAEVQQRIEMLQVHLKKKGEDMEAELLHEFANKMTLSPTPQEVDGLLANLSSLSITSRTSRTNTNQFKAPSILSRKSPTTTTAHEEQQQLLKGLQRD